MYLRALFTFTVYHIFLGDWLLSMIIFRDTLSGIESMLHPAKPINLTTVM